MGSEEIVSGCDCNVDAENVIVFYSMRKTEIEAKALIVIDAALQKRHTEDDLVELKTELPEPKKTARQLAGHCNAARGEPVLWLFGVNENAGLISSVTEVEFSNWYQSVKAEFDEPAPEPIIVNIHHEQGTVIAAHFETEFPPYVIKNPRAESLHREVPWRGANGTNSATRAQLLRLFVPLTKVPTIEILAGYLIMSPKQGGGLVGSLQVSVFATQPSTEETTFAKHICECAVHIGDFGVFPTSRETQKFTRDVPNTISNDGGIVTVKGTGSFEIGWRLRSDTPQAVISFPRVTAEVRLIMTPAGSTIPILAIARLESPQSGDAQGERTWEYGQKPSSGIYF